MAELAVTRRMAAPNSAASTRVWAMSPTGVLAAKALAWQKTLPKSPIDPGAGTNAYPWPKSIG